MVKTLYAKPIGTPLWQWEMGRYRADARPTGWLNPQLATCEEVLGATHEMIRSLDDFTTDIHGLIDVMTPLNAAIVKGIRITMGK